MDEDEFEARVLRFELGRRLGGPDEVARHLDEPPELAAPDRARLLVELICVDMERGWRESPEGGPFTLSAYIGRFLELNSFDDLPLELVAEEYRARHRWGDRPPHSTFLARFHARREYILRELIRVDDDIAAESVEGHPKPRSTQPEPGSNVSTLSYRDFLLRRMIGAGHMGKVYRASRRGGGREVAVKFLRKSLLRRPEEVGRFLAEARTVSGLRHPGIVATEGLGRTPGGSYFIVMELVDGPDLARFARGRAIDVDEAIGWILEACEALEHAHERGVIHCDIKPGNLLLDGTGRIRIADFGLARLVSGTTSWAAGIEGTAPFMAPEQASRRWGPIDSRTDVYGIGATLFALLTGRPPHIGHSLAEVLDAVVDAEPVISPADLRPGLPVGVAEVCLRCLEKSPEDRYQSMQELCPALDRARIIGP